MNQIKLLLSACLLWISTYTPAQIAMGSDLKYQGKLTFNDQLLTGAYDFEVTAYDAISAGNIYVQALNLDSISVVNGIFALTLDFGDVTFMGNEVYLQIKVRENGSGLAFEQLSPRQKMSSAPYAIQTQFVGANAISETEILDGSITSQELSDNSITSEKLAINSIKTTHFQNNVVTANKLAMGSVGESAINSQIQKRINGTCTNGNLIEAINSDGSLECRADAVIPTNVTTIEIVNQTISAIDLANDSIIADKIVTNAVSSQATAPNSIDSMKIINNAISSADIDSSAIQLRIDQTCASTRFINAVFEDGSVNCALENDGTVIVTSTEIVDATIAAQDISTNAINNIHLVNNAVTANKLANAAIDANKINNSEVQLRITSSCENGTYATGFNQNASIICQPLPINLDFVVDSLGASGEYSSLVVNPSTGLAIISYYESGFGDLKIFFCNNIPCSSGLSKTLDSNFEVGQYSNIALASGTQYPMISYYDKTNKDLKLYICQDTLCNSGSAKTLDSTGDVGKYSDIIINSLGFALISYYDTTNKVLKVYACSDAACDFNNVGFTVDNSALVGRFTSMALRVNSGFPIISYKDDTNDSLKVLDCSNQTCALATERTLDITANVGFYTSIAVNISGLPVISYHDFSNKSLKIYSCSNANCTSGIATTLDNQGEVGEFTSIAIDPATNFPIISYFDSLNTALKMYFCSNETCTDGESKFMDNLGYVGEYSSIAIGDDGFPIVSYQDVSNADLKVFHCSNRLCN